MGASPTTIDASAYGFLIDIIGCPIEPPLKNHIFEQKNLVAYCQRMQDRYFPECGTHSAHSPIRFETCPRIGGNRSHPSATSLSPSGRRLG